MNAATSATPFVHFADISGVELWTFECLEQTIPLLVDSYTTRILSILVEELSQTLSIANLTSSALLLMLTTRAGTASPSGWPGPPRPSELSSTLASISHIASADDGDCLPANAADSNEPEVTGASLGSSLGISVCESKSSLLGASLGDSLGASLGDSLGASLGALLSLGA